MEQVHEAVAHIGWQCLVDGVHCVALWSCDLFGVFKQAAHLLAPSAWLNRISVARMRSSTTVALSVPYSMFTPSFSMRTGAPLMRTSFTKCAMASVLVSTNSTTVRGFLTCCSLVVGIVSSAQPLFADHEWVVFGDVSCFGT